MAPAKATKKKAPLKRKATQAKGKEIAASTAALQAAKKKSHDKNTSSKSDATRAKGKKSAASTAALQSAKKKNKPRRGSDLGCPEASGAGGGSTTAATSVAEEVERLKAEILLLRKEKADAVRHAPAQRAEITAIPKPRGEAGSKGFKLIREMGLDDTAEHKQLYRAIMRGVRNCIIKRSIDLSLDFRKVDPDDLSAIFKWTRKAHPYMSKARFPQNWATAELIKQYMRNHRRYEVKKGRMMPRHQRSATNSSGDTPQLHNVDSDEDRDMDEENDEDEDDGGGSNESGAEDE